MKRILALATAAVLILGCALVFTSCAKPGSNEFKVGLECAYAPYNWTQSTDAKGAVQISGSNDFAGGYDVEIAKKIAEGLGKKLVIVKTVWDGLTPAVQSGTIDAIIAGMSATDKRKQTLDFSDPYYNYDLVIIVKADSKFAGATSLADFAGAKITAQLDTLHYGLIDQIPDVQKQTASQDFPTMRVALDSGSIDGYVSETPEGISAQLTNPNFKMIIFEDGKGFEATSDQKSVSVGLKKGSSDLAEKINKILAGISEEQRDQIMQNAVKNQPAAD